MKLLKHNKKHSKILKEKKNLKKPKLREKESELKKKLKLKFGDLKKEKPLKRLKQLLLKKRFLK
jgi:hypothetical protein